MNAKKDERLNAKKVERLVHNEQRHIEAREEEVKSSHDQNVGEERRKEPRSGDSMGNETRQMNDSRSVEHRRGESHIRSGESHQKKSGNQYHRMNGRVHRKKANVYSRYIGSKTTVPASSTKFTQSFVILTTKLTEPRGKVTSTPTSVSLRPNGTARTYQTRPTRGMSSALKTSRNALETKSLNHVRSSSQNATKTTKRTWALGKSKLRTPRFEKRMQHSTPAATKASTIIENTRKPSRLAEEPLACKIPALDPFHPHVVNLQNDVGTDLRAICLSMHPYTPAFSVLNNKLVLKDGVKMGSIVKDSIQLREIRRVSDDDFSYENPRNPFDGLSDLHESNDIGRSDFFRLEYEIDGRLASDLYARVSPKPAIVERQRKLARRFRRKGLPLNVLIIGIDSVSRANFVRKLPRVRSFLEKELSTYFMEGMSIVGDATTPILTAMLTGRDEAVLPEGRTSWPGG